MSETIYSLKQITSWQTKLTGLAQKPRTRFSKKQAVEAMIEEIELALQSHPYEEVAENLKEWGLDIAPGSLKQYVNAYRREHPVEGTTSTTASKRSNRRGKRNSSKKRSPSVSTTTAASANAATTASAQKASRSSDRKATRSASDKAPKGFIEMPEEL